MESFPSLTITIFPSFIKKLMNLFNANKILLLLFERKKISCFMNVNSQIL